MSAPIGNKHAERWTRARTIDYLARIEKHIERSNVIFIGHALLHVGLYNDIWAYWKQKWEDDEEIYHRMMVIMQQFETRIFLAALQKEVHAGVAMFALRVHYGWSPPRPPKEAPVPSEPAPPAPAPRQEIIRETSAPPKEKKPLIMKTFPDTSHLIPVTSYCGLPTFMEAGKAGEWARCGPKEYFKVER